MARTPAVVVVNRTARRAGTPWEPALRAALEPRHDVEMRHPRGAEEATAVAREAAGSGAALVVAAGGDGTASAVAAALVGTRTALGLLPLGTANDFARALGLPADPRAAAARLAAGRTRDVDVLDANGRSVCTVAGLGLVSRSALAVCAVKSVGGWRRAAAQALGAAVYKLSATAFLLAEGSRVRRYAVTLRTPAGGTRTLDLRAHGAFIANQRFLGGGLALPSGSSDDDGVFELCVVNETPRARLLDAFARLSLGARIPDGVLSVLPATEAVVRCDEDDELLGDGDEVAVGREFRLRAVPRALRVVV